MTHTFTKDQKKRIGKAMSLYQARQNRTVTPQLSKLINHWKHVSKDNTSWKHVYVFDCGDPDEVADIMASAHYDLGANLPRYPGDIYSFPALFYSAGPDRVFVVKHAGYDV
jgi:hypothetical protein